MDLFVQRQYIVIIKWVGSYDKYSLKGTHPRMVLYLSSLDSGACTRRRRVNVPDEV